MLASAPANSQRLVSGLSDKEIAINSTFTGEKLTLFGNVEPEIASDQKHVDGPFNVIVVISGPALDRVARQKTNQWGIWLNTKQLIFEGFPSFFWVISSERLENIATHELLMDEGILPETRPNLTNVRGNGNHEVFGTELVRKMTEEGLFGIKEHGLDFRSNTLYSAQVSLPANVPNGNFLAHTYLFKDGKIVSRKAEGFSVRKTGFERFIGNAAKDLPWLYGLICVLLAIFTGWLGGVAFRR